MSELVEARRAIVPEPIVYEDFLPRSAAGIFQLQPRPARAPATRAARHRRTTSTRLAGVLGATVHDPIDLYAAQQDASLRAAAQELGVRIVPGRPDEHDLSRSLTS